MAEKPRVVLSMIVKNESAVIERCLRSVKPYITGWAISDTGSTDGTQGIIQRELAGIPGELIERPWRNFCDNRNDALELAEQQNPEWILLIDADEELIPEPGFSIADAQGDAITARFQIAGTSAFWGRKLLLRGDAGFRYEGILDEFIDATKHRESVLPCCSVLSYTDGARSKDGLKAKFERDAAVYAEALKTEPDNARYWFYYGQRLAGAERYDEAIAAYTRRIQLGGWAEEVYFSLQQIAAYREARGDDWRDVARSYQEAHNFRPERAEPLFALAVLHKDRKEYALAEMYARQATRTPRPQDVLTCDESVYAWRAADELAGILAERGKLPDALSLLENLYALPQLPKEQRERVAENIALIRKTIVPDAAYLGPDEQIYAGQAAAVRAHGAAGYRKLAQDYLRSFQAQTLPSPVRWLWIALVALFGRAASWAPALACPALLYWAVSPITGTATAALAWLLAAASPVLAITARRRLQDPLIAALTLAAVGFAVRGNAIGLGATVFALLACKEAAALMLPALLLAWSGSLLLGAGSLAAAGALASLAAVAVFGPMTLPILLAGAASHRTSYTKTNQRGAWHRLIVDFVLASPVTTLIAIAGAATTAGVPKILALVAAMLAAHLRSPVRSIRLVLAAELLMRAAASAVLAQHSLWLLVPALAADLFASLKLRNVYDPVTAALTSQLGMTPSQ